METMMAAKVMETALNIWAISDQGRKQKLRCKLFETHGELTPKNDFVGFLVAEFGIEQQTKTVDAVRAGGDG